MTQETTLNLQLPLLIPNQSGKEYTHNEALIIIDAILGGGVQDANVTTPPATPQNGHAYIIGTEATGVFSGHEQQLAFYYNGWRFITAHSGLTIWVQRQQQLYNFNGSEWNSITLSGNANTTPTFSTQNLPMVGINTSADNSNKLSVSSDYVLFNCVNNDSRIKVNKANAGCTASHLFQSNWSARSEFGLLGNDNFTLKTSGDGQAWQEAFVVEASTGDIDFKHKATVRGMNLSEAVFPSDRYNDLKAGASNSTLTAASSGYIIMSGTSTAANQFVTLHNTNKYINGMHSVASVQLVGATVPCRQGDVIQYSYNIKVATFRLVYTDDNQ